MTVPQVNSTIHYINDSYSITMAVMDSTFFVSFLALIAYLFWFQRCRKVYTKTDKRSKFIIAFYLISVAVSGINWTLFLAFKNTYDLF